MTSLEQPLPGVHLLRPKVVVDARGDFVKTFYREAFAALGLHFDPVEEFFSTSHWGVLRGMHFQVPPADHAKLVYCIRGRVLDVLLDLRKGLPTYGRFAATELSRVNHHQFFIPAGVAHGFLALENDSVLVYKTTTVHSPCHDAGVRWDSFGFDWQLSGALMLSPPDAALPLLADFASPFA